MTTTNVEAWTRVKVSFFEPSGFVDTHYIQTDNRGAAVLEVLDKYKDEPSYYLERLNYVTADPSGPPPTTLNNDKTERIRRIVRAV